MADARADDAVAIPPAPNWYGSNLADWGGADGELYAYAARNAVVLLRPLSPDARHAGALVGHTNRVTGLCFARGPGAAHLLISGSADKNLRLWDTTARRCLRVLRGHAAEVSAVSASPLASDLFVSGDRSGKVCVWRLGASGGGGAGERPARVLTPLDGTPVLALAMSPAAVNDVAVGHQSGALAVADADGATPRRLPSRAAEVQQLAWLPPPEDDPQRTYDGDDSDGVRTGDPAVLAVGGRERAVTLWTWDGSRTSLRATFALPRAPPHASEPHRGRLWLAFAWCRPGADGADGADGHDVAWLVTASHAGEILRWTVRVGDLRGDAPAPAPAAPERVGDADASHRKVVFSVVVRNGNAMTTSLDRTLALWDLRTRRRLWSVAGLGGFAYAVSLKPEDPFAVAVACGDGTVRAADPRIGFEPTTSEAHASDSDNVLWRGLVQTKTTCMAWYPADDDGDEPHPRAGSFVVGLEDGRIVDVDPAAGDAGRYAVQRDCHGGPVTRAQWVFRSRGVSNAPPVRELVTLGDGRAWRWTELAPPVGGVWARPGSGSGSGGGGFVDVTMRFHDADTTGEMTTFEFTDDGAFVAVGWSDGSVTTHRRDDSDENPNAFAFTTAWRATEFGKRVTAVRWHPDATDANSPRFGWVGATSADGGFMVFDREGRVVRSAPRCRQGLLDLAWRPPSGSGRAAESGAGSAPAPDDRGGDAVAATAGADGLARVWNVTNAPALVAVMRGHEGRVLCLCWTRPGALSRGARAALLTGSDDQTVRRWDPDDPRHSPAVAAEAAARAKNRAVVAVLPDADANERKETDASMSDASAADGETPPVARGDASGSDPDASALPQTQTHTHTHTQAGKKKRKGTAGRGLVKPPAWESTSEGIAAGRASAVALARSLAASAKPSGDAREGDARESLAPDVLDPSDGNPFGRDAMERILIGADVSGYGPRGLGLFFGQTEAMRLLRLEERASLAGDGSSGAGPGAGGTGLGGVADGGSGAFRGAERAAAAAIFRGDFDVAADLLFAAADGPIPADFLASLVGGGRDFYADVVHRQADRLEARGEHQRAAVLRLSVHDVRGAIGSLRAGGLQRDAAALAAARLLPEDPAVREVRRELAAAEENRGGAEAAAKAHLASGRPAAAVRALTRPGLGGARAAAEVALVMGCRGELEKHAVLRAAREAGEAGLLDDAEGLLRRWKKGGGGGEEEDFLEVWAEVKTRRAMESASGGADASGDRDI